MKQLSSYDFKCKHWSETKQPLNRRNTKILLHLSLHYLIIKNRFSKNHFCVLQWCLNDVAVRLYKYKKTNIHSITFSDIFSRFCFFQDNRSLSFSFSLEVFDLVLRFDIAAKTWKIREHIHTGQEEDSAFWESNVNQLSHQRLISILLWLFCGLLPP